MGTEAIAKVHVLEQRRHHLEFNAKTFVERSFKEMNDVKRTASGRNLRFQLA